jgi:ribonuclease HI
MINFGIFVSDASFDHKTRTSVIGIKELVSKQTFQKITSATSPTHAEKLGIEESLRIALNKNITNCVFISDNKKAINNVRQEFFKKELNKTIFWYVQFLWIPRDFISEIDSLSKNVSSKEEVLKVKQKNSEKKFNKIEKNIMTTHINDIKVNENEIGIELFKKRCKQFLNIKESTYESVFFKNINRLEREDLQNLLLEEINIIENDLKNIKDPFEKALAQTIVDILIRF